jgi:hypothetical protein
MYKLPTSLQELSFGVSDEDMMALDPKQILAETARNKTRRENDIRTSRGQGDYIAKKFSTKGKYQIEPESERGDEEARP